MTRYNCPSYYNDNNELVDCTCGECGLDKQLEDWGIKHLNGKFMFEPMWLDAKKELKKLIIEAKIEELKSLNYDYATCIDERISELKKELESL